MADKSLAYDVQRSTEDHDHQEDRPCACNDGWDEETGEYALYLCRRCAEEGEERF